MKRDTRAWLRKFDAPEYNFSRVSARDVLDSHARQRSEIRRLRAALHEFVDLRWRKEVCTDREWAAIQALKPRRR